MRLAARLTTLKHLAIGLLVGLLFAGCKSLFDPPRPITRMPTQTEIIRSAQDDYEYGPRRSPRDTVIPALRVPTVADDAVPIMTIETMTRKRTARIDPSLRLIARINSSNDYPHLGIRRGDNFVWRDFWDVNWLAPIDTGARSHRLVRVDSFYRRPMVPHEPGLLKVKVNSTAIVLCLDCFPTGHCGYQ